MQNPKCLGCQMCETGAVVKLDDGRVVCNCCPDYLVECEARSLLALPERAREDFFLKAERSRGEDAIHNLKEMIRKANEKARLK